MLHVIFSYAPITNRPLPSGAIRLAWWWGDSIMPLGVCTADFETRTEAVEWAYRVLGWSGA